MSFQKSFFLVLLLTGSCFLSGCRFVKAVFVGMPALATHQTFESYTAKPSDKPFHFKGNAGKSLGDSILFSNKYMKPERVTLNEQFDQTSTLAFLIIRNDSLIYQNFREDFDASSEFTSFSVAKSFVSALLGIAIEEGFIKSEKQAVTDFLPELLKRDKRFADVRISHLLKHTSGIRFVPVWELYYGKNLQKLVLKSGIRHPAGTKFKYDNGNSQMIAMIIEKATGRKLGEYFEEKLWRKIGTQNPMKWNLDSRKNENAKAFCCLNGNAYDFAKLGRLYMNNGKWDGEQVVPEAWVKKSTAVDTTEGSLGKYQYHWWVGPREYQTYSANGLYGQFVYVNPRKNLILVRFTDRNFQPDFVWFDIFLQMSDVL